MFDREKYLIKKVVKKENIQLEKEILLPKIDFPINIFPPLIEEFINKQSVSNNFNRDLLGATFLWTAATLIGNSYSFKITEGWNDSPVMWLMVIASRGSRKTHAMGAITRPIDKIDNILRDRYLELVKGYDKEDELCEKPIWKQVFVSDGTREGYIKALINNPGGVGLLKDELSGWLADMNRFGKSSGGDEAFWNASFNNNSYRKNLASTEGEFIERMFINLAGSIQPGLLNKIIYTHTESGLFDRFLIMPYDEDTVGEFKFDKNDQSSYESFQKYENFLKYFWDITHNYIETVSFTVKEDVKPVFEEVYNMLLGIKQKEQNKSKAIYSYMAKLITYFTRICLVIEVVSQIEESFKNKKKFEVKPYISEKSIFSSYLIIEFFLNTAKSLLSSVDKKQIFDSIIKKYKIVTDKDKRVRLVTSMLKGEIVCTEEDLSSFLEQPVSIIKKSIKELKIQLKL